MSPLTKRATVYFDPKLHRALRIKSAETSQSMSEMINSAVRESLAEDAEDLAAFDKRVDEPLIVFETYLQELKRDGKI